MPKPPSLPPKGLRRYLPGLLVLLCLTSPLWVSHLLWRFQPVKAERITLVDYTVPFENAREHRGATWLLNHEKYAPPFGRRWERLGTYSGYDPKNRPNPIRIDSLDLSQTDWLYLADTYGVYEDDLLGIDREVAHMDYSVPVFGGLTESDASAIAALSARGKHIYLEFNSLEEPTAGVARASLERLLGITWTGWTGRAFRNLYDTTDVPRWLPRLHRAQYGTTPMPTEPTLALVHRDGRLALFPDREMNAIAPQVTLTARGEALLPRARSGASYYYWFPVYLADDSTEVLAEYTLLPGHPDHQRAMDTLGIARRIPLLTRRTDGGSHRIYTMGDFSDTDFAPGWFHFRGLARYRAFGERNSLSYDSRGAYWQFFVPSLRHLLRAPFDSIAP